MLKPIGPALDDVVAKAEKKARVKAAFLLGVLPSAEPDEVHAAFARHA